MSKDLMPGETLVLRTHQHWVTRVRAVFLTLLLVALVAAADWYLTMRVAFEYRHKRPEERWQRCLPRSPSSASL